MGEGDDRIVQSIYDTLVAAFNEDRDIISAQGRTLAMSAGVSMLPLPIDAALNQYRRLVDAELAREWEFTSVAHP